MNDLLFQGVCRVILILSVLTSLDSSPPCHEYGSPPCSKSLFLPAPPGHTPSCAKHGETFCEHIEHYPEWVRTNYVWSNPSWVTVDNLMKNPWFVLFVESKFICYQVHFAENGPNNEIAADDHDLEAFRHVLSQIGPPPKSDSKFGLHDIRLCYEPV